MKVRRKKLAATSDLDVQHFLNFLNECLYYVKRQCGNLDLVSYLVVLAPFCPICAHDVTLFPPKEKSVAPNLAANHSVMMQEFSL